MPWDSLVVEHCVSLSLSYHCLSFLATSPTASFSLSTLQNVVVTYAGMKIGGDYVFDLYNFIGINIRFVYISPLMASSFKMSPSLSPSPPPPPVWSLVLPTLTSSIVNSKRSSAKEQELLSQQYPPLKLQLKLSPPTILIAPINQFISSYYSIIGI